VSVILSKTEDKNSRVSNIQAHLACWAHGFRSLHQSHRDMIYERTHDIIFKCTFQTGAMLALKHATQPQETPQGSLNSAIVSQTCHHEFGTRTERSPQKGAVLEASVPCLL
jgi:hypothetical protein